MKELIILLEKQNKKKQTLLIKHVFYVFCIFFVLAQDKLCCIISEHSRSKSGLHLVWVRNTVIDWAAIIESLLLLVYKLAGGLNTEQLGNLASSWIQLKKSMFCPQ